MLFAPPRRKRRLPLAGIVVLLATVCMLLPTAASAHRRARLESQVSEEAASGALQEPTSPPTEPTSPPTSSEAAAEPTSSEEAPAAPSGHSRREERRARRDARRDARVGLGCTVDLQAPRIVSSEASLTLLGTLSCPEAEPEAASDQTVTLYQKVAGTPGFAAAATTSTEANGNFQFPASGLELNSSFYVRADGAKSARISVQLAPTVTLSAPAAGTPLFTGGGSHAASAGTPAASTPAASAVTFSGTVSPVDAGATVALEREFHSGGWDRIGLGHVNQEGSYSIVHTFFKAGEVNIRVVVRSHGLYMKSASTPVAYLISRRRSSRLTIQASADPLAYGAAVALSGTVAGPEGQTVTLFARTTGGAFAPIATAVTVGGGYSFSQSPLQSTSYRVATASASSALLGETVTYALAPTPAPASVIAGEQLTFTGSVTPAHEGQPVELERENLSGLGGYHVIASGTVASAGTYSIAYAFRAAGNPLLRIRVPGDAEIGTAESEPFKLEVTPSA